MHHTATASLSKQVNKIFSVFLGAYVLAIGQVHSQEVAPLTVLEVADGVFAHAGTHGLMIADNGGDIANTGFVVGTSAVAVIDSGGSFRQGVSLLAAIRQRTDLPIRWVINTHMHPDHVFGNAAFLGPDVAFVGHANLGAALTARFDHYVAANTATMGAAALEGTTLVTPGVAVRDRMEIDLGGRILELQAWPVAHTDNDLTVLDSATGTLFTGDLVFLEHLPSIDGSLRGWQRVLDDLAAIPATRAIPGHGPLGVAWPDALEPERRYFDVLAADVEAAIDAGVPLSEAAKTAGRSEAGAWELFDEFNSRNATAAFAELEWE